jgi:hypothetical protein
MNPKPAAQEEKARLFACACVREIKALLIDARSRKAVEVAEHFCKGTATSDDLLKADREAAAAVAEIAQHSLGSGRYFAAEAARWTVAEAAEEAGAKASKAAASAAASEATAAVDVTRQEAFEAAERKAKQRQAEIRATIYGPAPGSS